MLSSSDIVFSSTPLARFPFLERLAPVREAGFQGISIQPQDIWELEGQGIKPAELRQRVADAGLEIAEMDCIATWLPQHAAIRDEKFGDTLKELTPERLVPMAAAVGARSITIAEIYGVRPSAEEGAAALAPVCQAAAGHGLLVNLEFAPFGGIKTLTQALAILEASGCANATLTIDAWHFFQGGSTLAELAHVSGSRIGTVQLNDGIVAPIEDHLTACMTSRHLPGAGSFDLVGLVQTLDRIGSEAPIGIEVFSERQKSQSIVEITQDWAETTRCILKKARGK